MPEDTATDAEQPVTRASEGRQRLRDALLRPSRGQLMAAVLLGALGFGAVTQVRVTNADNAYAGYRQQQLIELLNGMTDTAQRAQDEIARLESTERKLRSKRNRRRAAIEQAEQEADTLGILAGWLPATGPGIRLTITEGGTPVGIDVMLDLIEELRTAGAEVMEFNDSVRIIAQSALESGVGGIIIDGTTVAPPYVIDVIGDPTTLQNSGLDFPEGPRDQVEALGASMQVVASADIVIRTIRQPVKPGYAEPDPAG